MNEIKKLKCGAFINGNAYSTKGDIFAENSIRLHMTSFFRTEENGKCLSGPPAACTDRSICDSHCPDSVNQIVHRFTYHVC